MAQENVEIVREAWGAWLRGDLDTLFANYFDREAIYDLTHFREWPDNTYQGIDGVRRGLTEWLAVWEAWEARVDDVLAAPDGRVVVLTWQRGKGRGVGFRWRWNGRRSSPFVTAGSRGSTPMTSAQRPSKPWGCGLGRDSRYSSKAAAQRAAHCEPCHREWSIPRVAYETAFALIASNSCCVIVPSSSSALALAISSAEPPAASRTYWSNCSF